MRLYGQHAKLIFRLLRSLLCLVLIAGFAGSFSPAAHAAIPWGTGVQLSDNGDGTVTLQNEKVSLIIEKTSAVIKSIRYNGATPDTNLLGSAGAGYYIANYSVNGTGYQKAIGNAVYKVNSSSSTRTDVSFTVNDPSNLPFYLEVHMVMEAGSPGFYYYTIYKYTSAMPDGLQIGQLRYAFRTDGNIFKYYAVDDKRKGTAPTNTDLANGKELQDATYQLPNGKVYTKYQYISDAEGDNHVFGVYGSNIGMSLIQANKESVVSGPIKQELTTHMGGPMLLWHEFSGHYGSTDFAPPKGWAKIYGPFYLYINEGSGLDAMWKDAKSRAAAEMAKWPYTWITDPLYAASTRGSVTGKLAIADGTSAANASIILGDGKSDWQIQNLGYLYSVHAGSDGSFTIPAIRPGTYTLYSYVDGVLGEYRKDGVTVASNAVTSLGTLTWKPVKNGTTLWQIGKPDRKPDEFYITPNGSPNMLPAGTGDFRKYGTWLQYPLEFPNGVDFKVGVDDPATKWNYFQPAVKTPGDPATLKVPQDNTLATWKIRFDSAQTYTAGTGTMTVALASSVFGSLAVTLNGKEIGRFESFAGPDGDNALYRQSDHGIYRQVSIPFDASLMVAGENVITLQHAHLPTYDAWTKYMTSIMYDTIRMEVDTSKPYFDPAATYEIINRNSGKSLDVSPTDDTQLVQNTYTGATAQQWKFENVDGGYYQLVNVKSGKVMDVSGKSLDNGADIIQYANKNTANQHWRLTDLGNGYMTFTNRNSGKVADVSAKSTADGAPVIQYSYNAGGNQQWRIVKLP